MSFKFGNPFIFHIRWIDAFIVGGAKTSPSARISDRQHVYDSE
jgi:hypothetical protein